MAKAFTHEAHEHQIFFTAENFNKKIELDTHVTEDKFLEQGDKG